MSPLPPNAVVTIVHGRHDHLRRQRHHLASGTVVPDLHVVVAMDDPVVTGVVGDAPDGVVIETESEGGALPLARARNAGAREAIARGAEVMVFLDVDCLPDHRCIETYLRLASSDPTRTAVLCGAVTYLPAGEPPADLTQARNPHPARPDPPPGTVVGADPNLFWSLSFAVTAATFDAIGGFCEDYSGYGGEDTDFAWTAAARGVPILHVGGADAYHQHHPSVSPPLNHVADLLANGAVFARRQGRWPMAGWFSELEQLGAVERSGSGWARAAPVRVCSIPAEHPFVSAIRPDTVRPTASASTDELLSPDFLRRHREDIDVLHLHFGFERLSVEQFERWCATAQEQSLPLLATVHDLRNPHLIDNTLHEKQLEVLARFATALVTLTDGAADAFDARYGRRPDVIPHPGLTSSDRHRRRRPEQSVGLHLKSLRANIGPPTELVRVISEVAGDRLRVDVHDDSIADPRLTRVRALADGGGLELHVHDRFDDAELEDYLASLAVSVLPHRWGTHSGWLELCRDLGTRVVAPDCGFYDQQWDEVITYRHNEYDGLDTHSLAAAVTDALDRGPVPARSAGERAEHDWRIRIAYARLYARLRR